MPGWPLQAASPVASGVSVVNATETVVATLSGVNNGGPSNRVILTGIVDLLTGTSTSAVRLSIRRGTTITDPLVGTQQTDTNIGVVGSTDPYTIVRADVPAGELANASYVLTVTQISGSANGTAVTAALSSVAGI